MTYHPGTHIIASLHSHSQQTLEKYEGFETLCHTLIKQFHLHKLGEVFHNFEPVGFTGVICLSESHISVHTFPEHKRITMDIYLSNYLRENDGTVKAIYKELIQFFDAAIIHEIYLKR